MITMLHNPRCRKSRETLELLNNNGVEPELVLYLNDSLKQKDLKAIIRLLKIKPEELLRKGEKLYKEKYKNKSFTDNEWIKIMVENPVLIERPIVIKGKKAIIGRPPENVLTLL